MMQKLTLIISLLLLVACASKSQQSAAQPEVTTCPEPRAQICTREYLPVCATRDTGIRCVTAPCPSLKEKTYGNACTACADAKVIAYRPGACEQDVEKKLTH